MTPTATPLVSFEPQVRRLVEEFSDQSVAAPRETDTVSLVDTIGAQQCSHDAARGTSRLTRAWCSRVR